MFALEMVLLTGRYTATRYNDRRRAEWPPHPARLYSALVAAHAADGGDSAERDALEWLEALSPPQILASDASEREQHTVFVPVNDDNVVADIDGELAQVREAEAALVTARAAGREPKTLAKLEKQAAQAQSKFHQSTAKKVARQEKLGKLDRSPPLPDSRMRQPRSFPSVTPESPRIVFCWPGADAGAHREPLDRVAGRVTRVGHSSSLVSVRVVESDEAATWVPVENGGAPMRVVRRGQLRQLEEAFEQHQETEPRVLPASFVGYTRPAVPEAAAVAKSVFGEDWLVLEVEGCAPFAGRIPDFTRCLRGALMRHAEQPVREILSGHRADGALGEEPHLAFLGLPFVGHQHADGLVRGFALVFPRDCAAAERHHVFRALAAWERSVRREGDDGEAVALPLYAGAAGETRIRRVDGLSELRTLDPMMWARASHDWVSVTPVALDRNPGDLRSRDPLRERRAVAEATQTVAAAAERIGLPNPIQIEILPSVPVVGALKARAFTPFPREPDRQQRVLTHVRLRFAEPVRGPVLLGAGRYQGLGLCRPVGGI